MLLQITGNRSNSGKFPSSLSEMEGSSKNDHLLPVLVNLSQFNPFLQFISYFIGYDRKDRKPHNDEIAANLYITLLI